MKINNSLSGIRGLLLAVLIILGASTREACAQPAQFDQAAVVHAWLHKDCSLDDNSALRDALIRYSVQLEPDLISAYRSGPERAEVELLKEDSLRRSQKTQELLRSGATLGLDPRELERLRALSPEQLFQQEQADFENRYRSRALAGLALIGGKKGLRLLEQVSKDLSSPLRTNAIELLKQRKEKAN